MRAKRRAIACFAGCAFRAALIVASAACLLPHGRARAGQAGRSPVKVFILAGQSNMEGKGRVSHLDDLTKDPARKATFGHLKTCGSTTSGGRAGFRSGTAGGGT